MEFLIVIAVVAILVIAVRSRAKERRSRAAIEAADRCARLAQEMRWAMEAAQKHPPGSSERYASTKKSEEMLRQIEGIASQHPEIRLRDLDTVQQRLRAIREERAPDPAGRTLRRAPSRDAGRVFVCLVDTETTGLSHQDEPITLAMLLLEIEMPKGHLVREVEQVYEMREPSVPIHPRAAAVHGLTADDLKGKRFDELRIYEVIERADVMIAHNAHFDRRMLAKIIPEVGHLDWRCSVRHVPWPTENKRLDTICEHFNIDRPAPHNAMSDVRALADCLLLPTGKTARSRSYLSGCLRRV